MGAVAILKKFGENAVDKVLGKWKWAGRCSKHGCGQQALEKVLVWEGIKWEGLEGIKWNA